MAARLITINSVPLLASGTGPFQVLGAARRQPDTTPWIVADAAGTNALRFLHDEMRAVFDHRWAAEKVATALNTGAAA